MEELRDLFEVLDELKENAEVTVDFEMFKQVAEFLVLHDTDFLVVPILQDVIQISTR